MVYESRDGYLDVELYGYGEISFEYRKLKIAEKFANIFFCANNEADNFFYE